MVGDFSKLGTGSKDPDDQTDKKYNDQFWKRTQDALVAELYTEFVPRWFKKKHPKLKRHESKAIGAWLPPGLKIGVGVGLYPLSSALDIGDYKMMAGCLGLYLAMDGIYQLFDLMNTYSEGMRRKAATLAVDLFSYPLYLIWSSAQR